MYTNSYRNLKQFVYNSDSNLAKCDNNVTTKNYRFQKLKPSFETLGVVADYLSRSPTYTEYKFGEFCKMLKHQLASGCHFVALRDRSVIGYAGWIYTTSAIGDKWLDGEGKLNPVDFKDADSAALTVVACDERALLFPIIRCLRDDNPGKRVFFKREYANNTKPPRKNTVLNFGADK